MLSARLPLNRYAALIAVLFILVGLSAAGSRPYLALALPAAALLLMLVVSWRAALVVLLAAATMNRLIFSVGSISLRPEMIASMLVAATAVCVLLYRKAVEREQFIGLTIGLPNLCLFVFFLYTFVISYINSSVFGISVAGMLQLAFACLGFVLVSQILTLDSGNAFFYVRWYIGLGIVQAFYALICFLFNKTTGDFLFGEEFGGLMTGQLSGTDWSTITWRGSLYEANLFSAYVGACSVFLVAFVLSRVNPKRNKGIFLCLVLSVIALVMGWTRSAWIGTVLGIAVVLPFYIKKLAHPKTILMVFLFIGLLVPTFIGIEMIFDQSSGRQGLLTSKLLNLFNDEEGTGKFRMGKLQFAWNDWIHGHPIVGNGYFSIKSYAEDEWITSMFMAILHDSGIIGLLIFLFMLVYIIGIAVRKALITDHPRQKMYLVGLLGGLAVMLVSYNFSPGHTLAMYWIHLGLIYVMAKTDFPQQAGADGSVVPDQSLKENQHGFHAQRIT